MAKYNHQNGQLEGLDRCPQCGISAPRLTLNTGVHTKGRSWGIYICATCFAGVMAESMPHSPNSRTDYVERLYPSGQYVPEELPAAAKRFLAQAISSIHAPDGAVMLLGSTVDAILKDKGFSQGSVYSRIDLAKAAHLLTEDMAEWAHSVRLGSNRPRHADADDAHVTNEEAAQALEYVQTLAQLLYVLPKRIDLGKAAAVASMYSRCDAELETAVIRLSGYFSAIQSDNDPQPLPSSRMRCRSVCRLIRRLGLVRVDSE